VSISFSSGSTKINFIIFFSVLVLSISLTVLNVKHTDKENKDLGNAVSTGVGGIILILWGFREMRVYTLIRDTPTSNIHSMAMGPVEIKGTCVSEKYIHSPLSHSRCVYYRYEIEEYQETVDSEGDRSYDWVTIDTGGRYIPFFLRDKTGTVYISPGGADFRVSKKNIYYREAFQAGSGNKLTSALEEWTGAETTPLSLSSWGLKAVKLSESDIFYRDEGTRRYSEQYITPGEKLYIFGNADYNKSADNEWIHKGGEDDLFLISNRSEKALLSSLKWSINLSLIFGFILSVSGISFLLRFIIK
jgi:hypothetical protein